ncbi:MAG: sensor histidine kinase [Butyrivibrio sp.]|nr:sensor histidine kinase [Butyrivibrio sp.]
MNREVGSFQDNIRRTFIRFSLLPVAIIVIFALVLFAFSWSYFMAHFNRLDNEAVASDLKRTMNIYYQMVEDVEDSITEAERQVVDDEVFSILYRRTAEFGEIGNLMILSEEQKVLFTSKGSVPRFLTQEVYSNWGVWNAVKRNKGSIATILYDKSLYIAKGIYSDGSLKGAIIYLVPGEVISKAASGLNRYVVITDKNGWVYASNTRLLQDSYGQIHGSYNTGTGYMKADGNIYYTCRTDTGKGLIVITVNDISRSIWLITVLVGIIVIIFAAISLITLRSTANSSEHYTRDIKKIENAFEAVSNGDFDVSLNIDSSKEFKIIGNDFNEMLQGLRDQIDENKELAENVAFSQVKQLESQFNPHFLFNTLDNIRFMAKIDAKAADKMIVSLSGLLRYSIRDAREEVTVREDLNNLQNYLNILQIRFNKRFAYRMDVAEDIMECLIPKLMLQPLLENAVKYGFGGKEKLTVNIRGYQMQEKIIFICEDDGAGIDKDRLSEIRQTLKEENNSSVHYGLYNIHRRVKLMYKDNGDYGLDISSKKDEGTTVRIVLPKHYAEN